MVFRHDVASTGKHKKEEWGEKVFAEPQGIGWTASVLLPGACIMGMQLSLSPRPSAALEPIAKSGSMGRRFLFHESRFA